MQIGLSTTDQITKILFHFYLQHLLKMEILGPNPSCNEPDELGRVGMRAFHVSKHPHLISMHIKAQTTVLEEWVAFYLTSGEEPHTI